MSARPTKKPEEKRSITLKLYVNPLENSEIMKLAAFHGYGEYELSEYLRRVALGHLHAKRKEAGL